MADFPDVSEQKDRETEGEDSDSEETIWRIINERRALTASIETLGRNIPNIVAKRQSEKQQSEANCSLVKHQVLALFTDVPSSGSEDTRASSKSSAGFYPLSKCRNYQRIRAAVIALCLPGDYHKGIRNTVLTALEGASENCVIGFKGEVGRREIGAMYEITPNRLTKIWGGSHFPALLDYNRVQTCYRYDCSLHTFKPLLYSQIRTSDAISIHI